MSDLPEITQNTTDNVSQPLTAFFLGKMDAAAHNVALAICKAGEDNTIIPPQFITLASILAMLLLVVVVGSYLTVAKPKNARDPSKYHPLFDPSDFFQNPDDIDEDSEVILSNGSAALMPLFAGLSLVALFYAIKHFDKQTLALFLQNYTVAVSLASNCHTLNYLIKTLARQIVYYGGLKEKKAHLLNFYRVTLSKDTSVGRLSGVEPHLLMDDSTSTSKILKQYRLDQSRTEVLKDQQYFNYYFSTSECLAMLLSLALSGLYLFAVNSSSKSNWILSNTIGINMAIFGISTMKINTFKTGFILLSGLFFYDIYFVFGSNIMETVATGLDIPLKLVFPRLKGTDLASDKIRFSMIGLGDLVVPLVLISLCLRYDLFKFHEANPNLEFHHLQSYRKPYFFTALAGYTVGLLLTFASMEVYQVAQPLLLYIVPSLLSSIVLTSIVQKDFASLWNYVEKAPKDEKANAKEIELALKALKLAEQRSSLLDDDSEEESDAVAVDDTEIVDDFDLGNGAPLTYTTYLQRYIDEEESDTESDPDYLDEMPTLITETDFEDEQDDDEVETVAEFFL